MTQIVLAREIYDSQCVQEAMREFENRLIVSVAEHNQHEMLLHVSPAVQMTPSPRVVQDFLNRVLELSIEASLRNS